MNRYFKTIAIAGLLATLTGCATAPRQAVHDPAASRAMNITQAASIDRLKDQKVTGEQYKHIIQNNTILDAGWVGANYLSPAHGFSSGAGLGITLASMVFSSGPKSSKNSLIAWMPEVEAEDEQQAAIRFRSYLVDAIEKALGDLGVKDTGIMATEYGSSYLLGQEIEDDSVSCGPYGEKTKRRDKCNIFVSIKNPKKTMAPSVINGNKYPAYAFTFISSSNFNDIQVKNAGDSKLNEIALYAAISKHLPEWAFVYLAPNKSQDDTGEKLPYPMVLEQGKSQLFITPDSVTQQ